MFDIFYCRGVLVKFDIAGQGPAVFAAGAGMGCLDFFHSCLSYFPFLSLSLLETIRYRP